MLGEYKTGEVKGRLEPTFVSEEFIRRDLVALLLSCVELAVGFIAILLMMIGLFKVSAEGILLLLCIFLTGIFLFRFCSSVLGCEHSVWFYYKVFKPSVVWSLDLATLKLSVEGIYVCSLPDSFHIELSGNIKEQNSNGVIVLNFPENKLQLFSE